MASNLYNLYDKNKFNKVELFIFHSILFDKTWRFSMSFKKNLIISALLVAILISCLSVVSASEDSTNMTLTSNDDVIVSMDEITDV